MMTRVHYRAIAQMLKTADKQVIDGKIYVEYDVLLDRLMTILKHDNERFDVDKFIEATQ
jgi:tartrate dehydratase beta subunit/fumarate hydratase class I family protein